MITIKLGVSPWTIIGAIAAAGSLVLLLRGIIWNWFLSRKPFNLKYCLCDGKQNMRTDVEIISGAAIPHNCQWNTNKHPIIIKPDKDYTIFLELRPRKSCTITGVELFFQNGNFNDKPTVDELQDINPQSQGISKPSAKRDGRVALYYAHTGLHTNRGGKAVDLFALCKTKNIWKGYLSMRLDIEGLSVCHIHIPCEVVND
jgi:hypothetical protein